MVLCCLSTPQPRLYTSNALLRNCVASSMLPRSWTRTHILHYLFICLGTLSLVDAFGRTKKKSEQPVEETVEENVIITVSNLLSTFTSFKFNLTDPADVTLMGLLLILVIPIILFTASSLLTSFYDLQEKHVLITGGSSGIGLEVAKEYIRRGANVTIMARNKEKLSDAVKMLEVFDFKTTKKHHKIISISVDVGSSQDNVDKAVSSAVKAMGRGVDVLVNCAGTSLAGNATRCKLEYHISIVEKMIFHLVGLFYTLLLLNLRIYIVQAHLM